MEYLSETCYYENSAGWEYSAFRVLHELIVGCMQSTFEDGLAANSYTPSEERSFREELRQFRGKVEYSVTSVKWCTAFLQYAQGKEIGKDVGTPAEATGRTR